MFSYNASLDEIKGARPISHRGESSGLKEKELETLFLERLPLYSRYADITINIEKCSTETVVNIISERIFGK